MRKRTRQSKSEKKVNGLKKHTSLFCGASASVPLTSILLASWCLFFFCCCCCRCRCCCCYSWRHFIDSITKTTRKILMKAVTCTSRSTWVIHIKILIKYGFILCYQFACSYAVYIFAVVKIILPEKKFNKRFNIQWLGTVINRFTKRQTKQ